MAVGEVYDKEKLVFVANITSAPSIPTYFKSVVRKGLTRITWPAGTFLTTTFMNGTTGSAYTTPTSSAGILDILVNFDPDTIMTISTGSSFLTYFYDLAIPVPDTTISGTLTTITTSGSYALPSGAAEIILVGGGASGDGGNNSGGISFTSGGKSGWTIGYYGALIPSSPFSVVVGAGGASTAVNSYGNSGGLSSITLSGITYIAYGGTSPGVGQSTPPISGVFVSGSSLANSAVATNSIAPYTTFSPLVSGQITGGGGPGNYGPSPVPRPTPPGPYTYLGSPGAGGPLGLGGMGGAVTGVTTRPSPPPATPPSIFTATSASAGSPGTGYGAGGGAGGGAPGAVGLSGGAGTPGIVYIVSLGGVKE